MRHSRFLFALVKCADERLKMKGSTDMARQLMADNDVLNHASTTTVKTYANVPAVRQFKATVERFAADHKHLYISEAVVAHKDTSQALEKKAGGSGCGGASWTDGIPKKGQVIFKRFEEMIAGSLSVVSQQKND